MSFRNLIWLSLALGLPGCVNLGLPSEESSPAIVYYVMEDAGRSAAGSPPSAHVLLLADTTAGAFYDTDGMAFSSKPGTRGYYQYARWSERAGKRFSDLLLERLESEKLFASVAQSGGNVRGDWLLMTDILELYHDAVQQPGMARLQLRAELVDLKTRKLLSRKIFVQNIPVSSFDAAGAHRAFNLATTQALNEMADWLKELASKP